MKVVGIQEKRGDYNGQDYHNVMIHCLRDADNAIGKITEVVKVKFSLATEVFGKPYTEHDWKALEGKEIRPFYDRYGKCTYVEVLNTDGK